MAKAAPPDKRPLVIRNPVIIEVRIGCMNHPDGYVCVVVEDGETHARFHIPGYGIEPVREPDTRCVDCNRADGRCEYASPAMVRALMDAADWSMERIHENGKRIMQPSIDAQKAAES